MTTTDNNKKLTTINLNGKYINAKPGQTIIQAAMDHGVYIPYLCYHPGLDPYELVECVLLKQKLTEENQYKHHAQLLYPMEW